MTVKVLIPAVLRRATQGQSEIRLSGDTIGECLERLEEQFPGIRERLCDGAGQIRRFVNIYVNGEDVRFLAGLATPLNNPQKVARLSGGPAVRLANYGVI